MADHAARRRATLLALAPLRLSPAAAGHARARARPRALPPDPGMQARIVAAARGAYWLSDGWRLFRGAPLGWVAAVFGYWLAMTLVSLVPVVGVAVAAVLVPAFSVGFMALARATSRGSRPELALFFAALRHEPRSQILLGIVYLACLAALFGASALADDGAL